jgi:choline transporter-like protein 2/4/5
MVMERSCTDVLCCLVFTVFLVALLGVSVFGIQKGDLTRLVTPYDSDGNECGRMNQDASLLGDRDFTEFPYKYLTQLAQTVVSTGGNENKYESVCVKTCPVGLDLTSPTKVECLINDDVAACPYMTYDTFTLLGYCLPEPASAKDTFDKITASMNESNPLTTALLDLVRSWKLIAAMSGVVFLTTFLYVFLLQWIAKPLLYISLVVLLLFLAGSGFFCFMKKGDYEVDSSEYNGMFAGAIVFWAVGALYLCFICCQYKNIALGASILQASSDFLSSNTRIIFMPVFIYILMIPVAGIWLFSTLNLMSLGTPYYIPDSYISGMNYENTITYLFLFMLFGLFWVIAFLDAIQMFSIAATCCMWYFSGQGSDEAGATGTVSILLSFKWALWYHLGSLAWGSFLIAVVTMIKVIFEYFAKKAEAASGNNPVVKMAVCCARCCIWMLDAYIKFINKNAYIQVAIHNKSFCKGAWAGFYLIVRHAGRFASSSLAETMITLLGKGGLITLNVWLTYLLVGAYLPEVESPVMPMVMVGIITFIVSSLFLTVFSFSALSILQCFILDEDTGGSTKTPDSLKPFIEGSEKAQAAKDNKVNQRNDDQKNDVA